MILSPLGFKLHFPNTNKTKKIPVIISYFQEIFSMVALVKKVN